MRYLIWVETRRKSATISTTRTPVRSTTPTVLATRSVTSEKAWEPLRHASRLFRWYAAFAARQCSHRHPALYLARRPWRDEARVASKSGSSIYQAIRPTRDVLQCPRRVNPVECRTKHGGRISPTSPTGWLNDLYEVVAFAEGFGTETSAIFDFGTGEEEPAIDLTIGRIDVTKTS